MTALGPLHRVLATKLKQPSGEFLGEEEVAEQLASANRSGRVADGGAGETEFSPMTITRLAPSLSAGLIGVLRRVPPSKYHPSPGPSTLTAGNTTGIAAEASMCSRSTLVAT